MARSEVATSVTTSLATRSLVRRQLLTPVSMLFVAIMVSCALGARIPDWLQYLPFALSLVVFGLPHGALDHLVPARLAGVRPTVGSISRVVLLYAVLGAAVFGAWMIAPGAAFVGFIALTWAHWGLGDLYALLALDGVRHLSSVPTRILAAVIRGAIPMLIPLIAFPGAYATVVVQATRVFDGGAAQTEIPDAVRLGSAVGFAIAIIGYLVATGAVARRTGSLRGWRRDGGELAVLITFFAVVPPVLAVGLYFSLWHALRHIVRLGLLDGGSPLARGGVGRALRAFALDAAPVTGIAIAILVTLAVLLPPTPETGKGLGLYLVLISALTVPHTVIVAYMDKRQGLWRRS